MKGRILSSLAVLFIISLATDPAMAQKAEHEKAKKYNTHVVCLDSMVCYTIDRSRPEWLGEPTPVDRPPEEIPESRLPTKFSLEQSYPNPFNPTVSIKYALPQNAEVRLVIYNIFGRVVRTLLDEAKEAGYYTVTWDGRDDAGLQVASGIYFYRITAGHFAETKRMILLK